MRAYFGSIEDVLVAGEYDQGDMVQIEFDELSDLVEQAKLLAQYVRDMDTYGNLMRALELRTNRPLHPVLGGKSPYSEFLPV